MARKNFFEQSAVERDYTKYKIGLGKPAENLTNPTNLTNPINKTLTRLNQLINSTFLSLKTIVDTLIDVGNAKQQNITSSNQIN